MAMRRSFGQGGMRASKPVSFSSGGGGNSLMNMMMAQSMLAPKQDIMNKAAVEKQGMTTDVAPEQAIQAAKKVGASDPGFVQPGTTWKSDVATGPINREITSDEATKMSASDTISRYTSYIRQQMVDDPEFSKTFKDATFRVGGSANKGQVIGIPTWAGNLKAQKMAYVIESMSQRLNYLLSGAQINENEFTRLSRRMPSWSHVALADPTDTTYEGLKFILDDVEAKLGQIKNRLVLGGNYDRRYWEGPNPVEKGQSVFQDQSQAPAKSPSSPAPTGPIPGMNPPVQNASPIDDEERFWQEYKKANP